MKGPPSVHQHHRGKSFAVQHVGHCRANYGWKFMIHQSTAVSSFWIAFTSSAAGRWAAMSWQLIFRLGAGAGCQCPRMFRGIGISMSQIAPNPIPCCIWWEALVWLMSWMMMFCTSPGDLLDQVGPLWRAPGEVGQRCLAFLLMT